LPKTKLGEKISWKEFFKRWGKGIKSLTPLQKLSNEMLSTFVMFVGYSVGLVSLIIFRNLFAIQWFTYALMIIFLGASWSNGIRTIALFQQVRILKKLDSSQDIDVTGMFGEEEKDSIKLKEDKNGNKK